jgi:glucose uptake protein
LCLGLWPACFRAAGSRYRFEIFSFDFALGAILLSLAAAYTFGTLGSDLNFSDTMLVAGRRSQVFAVLAGIAFALGNMLLLCTISLLGMARASLLSFSLASFVVAGLAITRANLVFSSAASCLFLLSFALALVAAKALRSSSRPVPVAKRTAKQPLSNATKGIITGTLSGLALGAFLPVLGLSQTEELGIGAYGGMLMACLGILLSTPLFNFYFMTLAIEGESLTFASYFQGKRRNRLLGFCGGVIWAAGALALWVVVTAPKNLSLIPLLLWLVPFLAALLTILYGLFGAKNEVPGSKFILGGVLCFLAASVLLAMK